MSIVRSSYESVLGHLPRPASRALDTLVYKARGRPYVYVDPLAAALPEFPRGSVTFSIDFELAWAWRYSKSGKNPVHMGLWEREQVPRLLTAFEEFNIPATWATVGHLFLEKCSRGPSGRAHEELPRYPFFQNSWWTFNEGDWFQHDPCTDAKHDPAWYCPDLIENIMASNVRHEMACHSFSHMGLGPYCPPEIVDAELEACIQAMKPFGVRPVSLVFPGNDAGNFATIAKKGFTSVRWFPDAKAEVTLPVRREEGLWGMHMSAYVSCRGGNHWTDRVRANMKRCVERAVERKMNAHFWFHPSLTTPDLQELLLPTLRYCVTLRDRGVLDVLTMEQLAAAMSARELHPAGELAP